MHTRKPVTKLQTSTTRRLIVRRTVHERLRTDISPSSPANESCRTHLEPDGDQEDLVQRCLRHDDRENDCKD